jgi:hypothetical protein
MTSFVAIVLTLFLLPQAAPANRAHDEALAAIQQAIEAMGGDARLRDIKTLKLEAIGHSYLIDQSERPEGPWVTVYEQRTEIRDFAAGRLRQTIEQRNSTSPAWAGTTLIVSDGAAGIVSAAGSEMRPARPTQMEAATIALALSPERVLFTAREAGDVALGREEVLQGLRQQVLTFTWKQARVRVLLNAYTHLPTLIDLIRDDPRGIWGEITERTLLTSWFLESNGLLYPRQWNMEWNGTPIAELSVTGFTPNPSIAADAFAIPATVREAFARTPAGNYRTMKLGQAGAGAQNLADGVLQIPGPWNVTFVTQPDGIVVIEAPISSEYSVQALDEAARRFPGVKVKAVITTSDAWPHLGGLREYVARGIPVYGLDLNRAIIDRLITANYRAAPDHLALKPVAIQFHPVSEKTTIGEGPNRIAIYPIHGENGERMMLVHLPERRLLYTSDDIIKMRSGEYFMPSFLADTTGAIERAGIGAAIDTVFGMHLAPTPWTEIQSTLARLRPPAPAH